MQTAKPVPWPMEPLRKLAPALVSLCLVMVAVDALLAYQPSLLRPLRDRWQSWVGPAWIPPSSASLVATSIAIACVAIAAVVLSSLIRGVQAVPYARLWTALVFVAAGAAAGYCVGYLPLKTRLVAQQARMQHQEAQQSAALHTLRARFDAERTALEQQLEEANAHTQPSSEAGPSAARPAMAARAPVESAAAATPTKSSAIDVDVAKPVPEPPSAAVEPSAKAKLEPTALRQIRSTTSRRTASSRKRMRALRAEAKATTANASQSASPAPEANPSGSH